MKEDEGLQWIWDVRRVISHELDNDPRKFVEFHRDLQSRYKQAGRPTTPPDRKPARAPADK